MITTKSEILNPTPSGKIYIIEKIGIDVVHGCQLRCLGCPNSTLKPKIIEMPPEDFGKILANIDVAAANLLRLFNFGEPLIHSRLPEIMEQIPRKRWQVGMVEISTNAQYHNFDVLADTFKTGVLSQLCVSADGDGTAEDYERLRPPGKWTRLIEFLETARDLRDRYSPKTKLLARTICTDPIAQKRWITVMGQRGWNSEFRDWMYLPGAAENMTGREIRMREGVCSFLAPGNRLYVENDGTVVPCCVHPRAGVLGNLLEQRYSEIVEGTKRAQMMAYMKKDREKMPICNACEF